MEYPEIVSQYLAEATCEVRLQMLERMRVSENFIPLALAQDLLQLRLNDQEMCAILRATSNQHNLAFEDFITANVTQWNQNIAATALWEWAIRSEGILWHRLVQLAKANHVSQRLSYTLLDLAWKGCGCHIVEGFVNKEGIEDLSPAFLAMLHYRALQFSVKSENLIQLSRKTLCDAQSNGEIPNRSWPYLLAYLYRFDLKWVQKFSTSQTFAGMWGQYHHAAFSEYKQEIRLNFFRQQKAKKTSKKLISQLLDNWPMIWERHKLNAEDLHWAVNLFFQAKDLDLEKALADFFAGVDPKTVHDFLDQIEDEIFFAYSVQLLCRYFDTKTLQFTQAKILQFTADTSNISKLFSSLPTSVTSYINTATGGKTAFDRASHERELILAGKMTPEQTRFERLGADLEAGAEEQSRRKFFDIAFFHSEEKSKSFGKIPADSNDYWLQLANAWKQPNVENLDSIALLARQQPILFQLCYIETLRRFKGIDNAALKLLDYIRSGEDVVLRTVIHALSGINTNRSIQELVAFLTRPNVNYNLQLEITQLLKDADLSRLQSELRSAINDLRPDESSDQPFWELRESLTSLLTVQEAVPEADVSAPETATTEDLDQHLRRRIASYPLLSSEAKRALRTAQFFHLQVEHSGNLHSIDLSPAIDMQYKALELSFREKFEDLTGNLIRQGILQRKLDVIGYARPIPRSMDEFEHYIESLPIIKSIPFFSRFKLRKMLRAICQFRPGKRFTLDGLKAFALFFVCFSRKECRYGLANLLPLPGVSDQDLFTFCKALHVFQDFRNRAAHEGFHPDASNDLDGIWTNTGSIIEGMVSFEAVLRGTSDQADRKIS